MSDEPLFVQIDLSVMPALEAWAVHASLRGKSIQDVMRKAMRFAVDFAINKTEKGDRARIKSDLTRIVSEYKGTRKNLKSKASQEYRGTLAAAIVFRLNYNNAQTLAINRSPDFYRTVRQFVSGRQYATNLHKAGWKPAQIALRGKNPGALPSFRKHPPGGITSTFHEDLASILVENWASAMQIPERPAPIGAAGLVKDLDSILPELETLFTKFLAEDMLRAAKMAGFTESTP